MKHWDGRDRNDVAPLRLSPRDWQRLAQFYQAPGRRRSEPRLGSLIGLFLSLALVVGLAWALSPVDPVAPELLK